MAHSSRIITCDSLRTYPVVYLDLALTPMLFSVLLLALRAMDGCLTPSSPVVHDTESDHASRTSSAASSALMISMAFSR